MDYEETYIEYASFAREHLSHYRHGWKRERSGEAEGPRL